MRPAGLAARLLRACFTLLVLCIPLDLVGLDSTLTVNLGAVSMKQAR